ncbi:MAG: hypothetical protein ABSC51_02100 [Gaiellaceae bacterium]|jgi:hypothetical protein
MKTGRKDSIEAVSLDELRMMFRAHEGPARAQHRSKRVRMPRRVAIGLLSALVIAGGVAFGVSYGGHTENAVAASILKSKMLDVSAAFGDPTPTSIVYVQTRRKAANAALSGDIVDTDQKVDVILATGNFDASAPFPPPGRKGPPIEGKYLSLVVDDATGEILDTGVSISKPDLSQLGQVQPLDR